MHIYKKDDYIWEKTLVQQMSSLFENVLKHFFTISATGFIYDVK